MEVYYNFLGKVLYKEIVFILVSVVVSVEMCVGFFEFVMFKMIMDVVDGCICFFFSCSSFIN